MVNGQSIYCCLINNSGRQYDNSFITALTLHYVKPMFHILSISSTTLAALRCKHCRAIIFRQDSITDFISYDKEMFGRLEHFRNRPKLQTEAEYFVLSEEVSYYSTIKVGYERSLIKNYHPFFKMHMFGVACVECTLPLGYQVETVNENTLWMQNRIIVDVQSCALLKDGNDHMSKLIKTLKTRLARKLAQQKELVHKSEQNEKKDIESDNKKEKQKSMIEKLQKMHDSQQEKDNKKAEKKKRKPKITKINTISCRNTQNKIFQPVSQKMPQSLATTNITSMNIMTSKQDTHHDESCASPNVRLEGQEEKKGKIEEVKEQVSVERALSEQVSKETANNPPFHQANNPNNLPRLRLTGEHRQQLTLNLQHMREGITSQSHFLQSQSTVTRIIASLKKLSSQQRYINDKIPSQLLTLNLLLTVIRKRYIENAYCNNNK